VSDSSLPATSPILSQQVIFAFRICRGSALSSRTQRSVRVLWDRFRHFPHRLRQQNDAAQIETQSRNPPQQNAAGFSATNRETTYSL